MDKLARITLTLESGRDIGFRAIDIVQAEEIAGGGSLVTVEGGQQYQIKETPAQIKTAIDALWDEYTAALGDPT
jgi:hypothetical protein